MPRRRSISGLGAMLSSACCVQIPNGWESAIGDRAMSQDQGEQLATLPRSHDHIRALTAEIRTLDEEKSRDEVDAVVQIGRRLARVKAHLAHGDWLAWLDEE